MAALSLALLSRTWNMLKVGEEVSCPLLHLHKQPGLFEGLQTGAVRDWGEQLAGAETPGQLSPF